MNVPIDALLAAKRILFWLFVVATVLVVVGVYWEGEHFEKKKRDRGRRLLMGALAAEILFTVLIFEIDELVSHIQLEKIIALESRLAARTLSAADAKEIAARLNRFAGQSFEIHPYVDDQESVDISDQISTVLNSAGWSPYKSENSFGILGVVASIAVHFHAEASQSTRDAALELVSALKDNHIAGTLRPANDKTPPERINVIVGIKP